MNTNDASKTIKQAADTVFQALQAISETLNSVLIPGRQQVLAIDESTVDNEALQLDVALLNAAPIVAAPVHSKFQPLVENGHRFILGRDGLYLEARRPWLHFIHSIGPAAGPAIPYGAVEPKSELAFGKLGAALAQLQDFAMHAMVAAPLEAAGTVLWNSATNTWRIEYPKIIGEATTASIQFEQVEPGPDEHIIVDLHSHGNMPAFFSATDDADDAGSVKIAGVYGNLDSTEPTIAFRMCVLGVTIPLNVPAAKIFALGA